MLEIHHMNFGWLHAPPLPPACCHGLLIRDGERIALVDTGIGRHDITDPSGRIGDDVIAAAGFLFIPEVTAASQIEELGLSIESVTDIVLTHGDPDHVGGLADFPSTTVHLAAEELKNIESGHSRYSRIQFSHGPRWKMYDKDDSTFFSLPARIVKTSLDAEIQLVPLFGHTAGHCGVAVRSNDSWVLHVGDAYYLRDELSETNHPINELAAARADDDSLRRQSLAKLRELAQEDPSNLQLCGYHDTAELPPDVPKFADVA